MSVEPNDNRLPLQSVLAAPKRGWNRWAVASVALHGSVLAVLLLVRGPQLAKVDRPGTANGHNMVLTFSPGEGAPVSTLQAKEAPPKQVQQERAIAAPVKPAPQTAAPSDSPGTSAQSGDDALGDGNITIALELQHPYPTPDLSHVPTGTRGDVIVDVVIDETGHVTKSTMKRGLGFGIDDTVLATIQRWTFQPALKNGVPVPSEQELLFHYEKG